MKYDFDLDMESNNSLSVLIKRITPNSKVLEFGPATGRMTQYMKNVLNCDVTIVEIDEESAKLASEFSSHTIIGDIEDYKWLDELCGQMFDYIVFADVLEHLYSPQKVLLKSRKLLNQDGSILISVPNIGHNSIIANLINDKFEYTDVGLLDDTHIRFFTEESLLQMIYSCKLTPVYTDATYSDVGENEVNVKWSNIPDIIKRTLVKRRNGSVYQYLMELKHTEFCDDFSNQVEKVRNIKTIGHSEKVKIYIDCGNGYSENQSVEVYHAVDQIDFNASLITCDVIKEVRIDPLPCAGVVEISDIELFTNNGWEVVSIASTNAYFCLNDMYFFDCDDPQIIVNVSVENASRIRYKCTYYKVGRAFDELDKKIVQELSAILSERNLCLCDQLHLFKNEFSEIIDEDIIDELLKSENKGDCGRVHQLSDLELRENTVKLIKLVEKVKNMYIELECEHKDAIEVNQQNHKCINDYNRDFAEIIKERDDIILELESCNDKCNELLLDRNNIKTELDHYVKSYDEAVDDRDKIKVELENYVLSYKEVTADRDGLKSELENYKSSYKEAIEDRDKTKSLLDQLRSEYNILLETHNDTILELKRSKDEIDKYQNSLMEETEKKLQLDQCLAESRNDKVELSKQLEQTLGKINEIEKKLYLSQNSLSDYIMENESLLQENTQIKSKLNVYENSGFCRIYKKIRYGSE